MSKRNKMFGIHSVKKSIHAQEAETTLIITSKIIK